MNKITLYGDDAIRYAEEHRVSLHDADANGDDTVNLENARRIAAERPDRLWVEVRAAANPAGDGVHSH